MKTVTRLTALLCLPLVFSCSRETLELQDGNVTESLTQGQWKVRDFNGASQSSLSGYQFSFRSDGGLSVTSNGNSLSGTWSLHRKVEGRCIALALTGASVELAPLNSQWDLVRADNGAVQLQKGADRIELGRP